jgi:hypothetical protein
MTSRSPLAVVAAAIAALLTVSTGHAADNPEAKAILEEIRAMKRAYEARIKALEAKIEKIEEKSTATAAAKSRAPASGGRAVRDNSFNPSIGVILNGKLSSFSSATSEIAGFGVGEEGERGREGLAIDESELNFSANVDDKFYGSTTVAIVREDGEDKVELEEAYIQTLPGTGLPDGLRVKAGRAFWTLGYLNEHHTHTDDFVDRPLPYRAYLNKSFNDDGVEVAWVLPTDMFSEIGGGVFRGDDFPFAGSTGGIDGWSAYGRIGGDVGDNGSWRIGAYVLTGDVTDRATNEGAVTFRGENMLYAADVRYTWAPTDNPKQQELLLQAEYFHRDEDGNYTDTSAGTGRVAYDEGSDGWYVQGVYKFAPAWRVGGRYSQLLPGDAPAGLAGSALDAGGHDPYTVSVMGDWISSEFGRIRLQYNREKLAAGSADNQFFLQYLVSIGAHGAHAF